MTVSSGAAKRIADDILLTTDQILAISIIDKKGSILAAKSKESFKAFEVTEDAEKYAATLAIGILTLVNELKDTFGEAQAMITIHKNCKLMLLPVPLYQMVVGLVFQPSVNVEDYYNIANKIERLFAYTARSQ